MNRLTKAICSLALISATLTGQTLQPKGAFILNLDYAKYKHNDSSSYLEVYFNFYPQLVTLAKAGNQYQGYIQVFTQVYSNADKRLVVSDRAAIPIVVSDTSGLSNNFSLVTQAGYSLPFGEYTLKVLAIDSLNTSRTDSLNLLLKMTPYATGVSMSDVELCSSIKTSDQKSDLFFKNSLEVVPSPSLVFGATAHPVLFRHMEFYNMDVNQTYEIQSRILDVSGKVVRESSKRQRFGVPNAVDVGSTTITSIHSGRYQFQVVLSDTVNREYTRGEKTFYLYNPHIKSTQRAMSSFKATELAGMSAEELGTEFNIMQYITTDQENKSFEQITSVDGRREFVATIWGEVEQGRLGKAPITRAEYLRRITSATRQFRASGRNGWKTDRGRVLAIYGEPDEIERHPNQEGGKPYEVWNYYQVDNGVIFVFVDRSSFGDYILVHSTKRGEIQDETWQRYLQ
jgi:GWxTD domain-containing protein